jgi:hypothetical protein
MLSRTKWKQNVGGVEKHLKLLCQALKQEGHQVEIITEKDLGPPKLKLWFNLLKQLPHLNSFNLIWIHDVFFWLIPFISFLQPKVITTFHGWEGNYPPKINAILQKQLAQRFSNQTISIGRYLNRWYHLKTNPISYGLLDPKIFKLKIGKATFPPKKIVLLDKNNSTSPQVKYHQLIKLLKTKFPQAKIARLTRIKFPEKIINESDLVLSSSYLAMLEAAYLKKPIIALYHHPLKKDYLTCHPLAEYLIIDSCPYQALIKYQQKNYNLLASHTWAKTQTDENFLNLCPNFSSS